MVINQPPSPAGSQFVRCQPVWVGLALLVGLILPAAVHAEDVGAPAKLTYSKVLEGSIPEYMMISVDSEGKGVYEGRQLAEPSSPRPFRLSPSTTQELFELCEQLNYFQSIDLESHKKVANLGLKSFAYEGGGRKNRVEFNYSRRRQAQELTGLFERIGSVQEHIATLEYAIKYDHLSLPGELRLIQINLDKKALAAPELMVPDLEEIVRNRRFLKIAQTRAQKILQRIQSRN
jgi:hypothetical protein